MPTTTPPEPNLDYQLRPSYMSKTCKTWLHTQLSSPGDTCSTCIRCRTMTPRATRARTRDPGERPVFPPAPRAPAPHARSLCRVSDGVDLLGAVVVEGSAGVLPPAPPARIRLALSSQAPRPTRHLLRRSLRDPARDEARRCAQPAVRQRSVTPVVSRCAVSLRRPPLRMGARMVASHHRQGRDRCH